MRIRIFGAPGTGKSFLAMKMGILLDIPTFHLDDFFWLPNWVENSRTKFKKSVEEIVRDNEWIIDGNYRTRTLELTLPRTTLIFFLDLPLYISLFRLFTRSIGRNTRFSFGFITPLPKNIINKRSKKRILESILFLWYQAVKFRFKKRSKLLHSIEASLCMKKIIIFRRPKEISEFLSLLYSLKKFN